MEKIKVGDYIRTHKGKIYKVTNVYVLKVTCGHTSLRYTDISKHSFNIIDLIEEGDYVNGYKIIIDEGMLLPDCKHAFTVFERDGTSFMKIWGEKDIKSIVTKEQFESMKYEVR
ncbi:MAG: hypothetical protein IJX99_01125 [Clostridia bacterium]|nr:hypothetical protein [Clostridia bacterium]MBQ8298473.1 hypothetical protein [Clostridia bacterium]